MNHFTSTAPNNEQPELTLEMLLDALERLDSLLPVVYYKAHRFAPLKTADGQPAVMRLPQSVLSLDLREPFKPHDPGGPTFIIFHPDNLDYIRAKARGRVRLVELHATPAPQEPQP